MKLKDLLARYPEDALDQIARDKVDEIANVRLPRSVLEREIATALSSYSYIADVMAASQPPTYVFLKLLMEAPGHRVPAAGFKESVMQRTDEFTAHAAQDRNHGTDKQHGIYRTMLRAAWESESRIHPNEANLLEVLRSELGVSMREHLQLEHHPEVRPIWDSPRSYENARNFLLARGLVLTHEDQFVLADEVRLQVRRYWGMELRDADYRRLLDHLTVEDLRGILEAADLPLSGSKQERVERIILGLVSPSVALDTLSAEALRNLSRTLRMPVSVSKAELVSQLVAWFDRNSPADSVEAQSVAMAGDGERQLADEDFAELLSKLSGNQLYEMLASLGLSRSGSKAERSKRLIASNHSDITIMSQLRRRDLALLCQRLGLPTSGLKNELVERITGAAVVDAEAEADESIIAHLPTLAETVHDPAGMNGDVAIDALPPEVRGLADVSRRYPELDADEHLILALLQEARSLTERDVQRLAARHGLGWVLPKAHMGELLRKLAMFSNPPIRIRSTGAANIYEWTDAPLMQEERLDRWGARDVIEALRQGVVPESSPEILFVGQDAAREHLQEQLEYVATGRSAFKFIRGAYGSGKSFLLAWLRDHALSNGFATASVRVGAELSMADLADFYGGLMDGLRTPEKRGASSLSDILEAWLLAVQRRVEQIEGIDPNDPAMRQQLAGLVSERISDELSRLAAHDPGLAPALTTFYGARASGNEELAVAATAWIRGDRSLSAAALRQIGVRGLLEPDQVLPRLRALLEIIASTHLRGLVILIDELELVRRRPHKQTRDQAYETLRALIDEVGENRLKGTLLISTGTDTFFEDTRYGIASYEALLHRISTPQFGDGHRSMRQPVIELDGLDSARLRQVALRTRDVHAAAYEWQAAERVTDADIDLIVNKWSQFGGEQIDRLPRPFLRQLVHVLDLCEENPELTARECIQEPMDDLEATEALMQLVMD